MTLKELYADTLAHRGTWPRVRITGAQDWIRDCLTGDGIRFGKPLCDAQLIAYSERRVRKWMRKQNGELLIVLDDAEGEYAWIAEMIAPGGLELGGLALIDSSEPNRIGWKWAQSETEVGA